MAITDGTTPRIQMDSDGFSECAIPKFIPVKIVKSATNRLSEIGPTVHRSTRSFSFRTCSNSHRENRSDLTPYVRNLQRETDESQDETQDSWESRPRQHKLQRPRPSFPRFSMRQLVPVPRFRAMIVARLCQLPHKVLLMHQTSFGFGRISVMTHTLLFSNVQGWKPLRTS